MNDKPVALTISRDNYDAVIFDLDGVITDTASVHFSAWKKLFDEYIQQQEGEGFTPFSEQDYLKYVDGKPRYEGVKSFLQSRGIDLPYGSPEDSPEQETICGLGNRKNANFQTFLQQGVKVYDSSVRLLHELKDQGIKIAVVTSSKNCDAVLEAVGLTGIFQTKVDGVVAAELGLEGKPAPATFLEAARELSCDPARSIVVEDAISGVQAGRRGKFGCVLGVDRTGQAQALKENGADVVVADLAEVAVSGTPTSDSATWSLVYDSFEPAEEGLREALCTLGNGYFATRGTAPENEADDIHYPGTYLAGGYNRADTEMGGRVIQNEDLVNMPNWLPLTFRINNSEKNGKWFRLRAVDILSYRQELDMQEGVLRRNIHFRDKEGQETRLSERRLVSMANPHLAALETTLTPINWSGSIEIRSALDGQVVNAGVERYRKLNDKHLDPLETRIANDETIFLKVQTNYSEIRVAEAARTRLFSNGEPLNVERQKHEETGYIADQIKLNVEKGKPITIEKIVALYTSRDWAIAECGHEARKALLRVGRFDDLLKSHTIAWQILGRRFNSEVELTHPERDRRSVMIARLHLYHLLQTVSPHTVELDVGVPARGWHGEAYRGHIFWDELFIFPLLNLRLPEITRALLLYRCRRLDEARASAKAAGYRGAMYPWQSASNGREETQTVHLNPKSGRWLPDASQLQRHVNIAIAYNVWQYYQVTLDMEFLAYHGAEMLLEIARFWASIATYNEKLERYEILGVMGPDEYHEAYPGAEKPGLNNNTYTNIMAVWVLCRALDVLDLMSDHRRRELCQTIDLTSEELEQWKHITHKMRIIFHQDGIISQFEGYEDLQELDWEGYRRKYGNIHRLDRILEAEGDTTNRYKLSKQADVLMIWYLLSADEVTELFQRLGYSFDEEAIPKIIEYYMQRTSHGSTLSRIVHSWVLARSDRARSWIFFNQALESDISDVQGGTTREGIHLGAMAGSVDLVQRGYTGIETRRDLLQLDPCLPDELQQLRMRIRYRDHLLNIIITHDKLSLISRKPQANPIKVGLRGEVYELIGGESLELSLAPPPPEPAVDTEVIQPIEPAE